VQAINGNCNATISGAWSDPITFTLNANISGNFYLDNAGTSAIDPVTGLCKQSSPSSYTPGSAVTSIKAATTTPTSLKTGTITNNTYLIKGVPYDQYGTNVVLNINPSLTRCVCPAGCSYSGFSSPKSGVDFYLSSSAGGGWWQSQNGLIYGANSSDLAVSTLIPTSTCTSGAGCEPAMSIRDSANTAKSSGIAITGGGDIDTSTSTGNQYSYLNEEGTTVRTKGMTIAGAREDYTYFSSLYSMGTSPTTDLTNLSNLAKPTVAPTNGRAYYAGSNVTISSGWNVASNESIVIFVNGDLLITGVNPQIKVAEGGFLAFIVKGNITFERGVGWFNAPNNTASTIEGVYIADKQIITVHDTTGGSDTKFVGAGTFVGWSGFQLQRSYTDGTTNQTRPIELFQFRPDFVRNAPVRMKQPIQVWQETN
jgi:hypothetical protein